MGTRKVELGKVGHLVAAEIRRRREQKKLSLQTLSSYLEVLGRPILPSGLSKIESGDRRVDVDDLVALADALGTVPSALLRGGVRQKPGGLTEDDDKIAQAAMAAIKRCEEAGMSRYQLIEWMNMGDGVRRLMERDPSGRELGAILSGETDIQPILHEIWDYAQDDRRG